MCLLDLHGSGQGLAAGFCEHGNETLVSVSLCGRANQLQCWGAAADLIQTVFKGSVPTSERTHCFSDTYTDRTINAV
jgi:hypothetical protein